MIAKELYRDELRKNIEELERRLPKLEQQIEVKPK
jgi:hypothetical protein